MIGIISDIHGNFTALQAVLAALDNVGIKDIVCLGDVVGYYCQINECCEVLRDRNIFTLQGNHDWYLATQNDCPRSNSANRCLKYQRSIITPENLNWLQSLKSQAVYKEFNIVHGGWNDPIDEYVIPSASYFESLEGHYFCSGHTHIPIIWAGCGKVYCNPGSIGQPRDGDAKASFAVWDGRSFSIVRIQYDYQLTQRAMAEAGFEPYFYENLAIGSRIGGKIDALP